MNSGPTRADITDDAVLGGRLRLLQPKRGHRVGHDAILLAAATAAASGEHAIDFGAGVGAAGLALAKRVPGLRMTLVEIDGALAALSRDNAERNALADRVDVIAADLTDRAALRDLAGSADHVLMNPPFNDPLRQQSSPDAGRRLAHVAGAGLLEKWVGAAALVLKAGGTLTLIWRAEARYDVAAVLAGEFGNVVALPVLPRPSAEPIRVIVRAIKGGAGQLPDRPALVLNDDARRPSAAAEAVLREGKPLAMTG